jgi:hypothetical protein
MNIIDKIKNYIKSVKKNQGISYERDLSVDEFKNLLRRKEKKEFIRFLFQNNVKKLCLWITLITIGITISIATGNILPFLIMLSISYSANTVDSRSGADRVGPASIKKLSSSLFVVAYTIQNQFTSDYEVYMKAYTVSGSNISGGSAIKLSTLDTLYYKPTIAAITESLFVVLYRRGDSTTSKNNQQNYLIAATVSGNTITTGTPVALGTSYAQLSIPIEGINSTSFIFCTSKNTYNPTKYEIVSRIGTLSGDGNRTISLGTEKTEEVENSNRYTVDIKKIDTNKFVLSWNMYNGSVYDSLVRVVSISGSTISYGSDFNLSMSNRDVKLAVNSATQLIGVGTNPSGYGASLVINVSGTTLSKGTLTAFTNYSTVRAEIDKLDTNKFIIFFMKYNADSEYEVRNIVANISGNNISYEDDTLAYDTYNVDVNRGSWGIASLDTDQFINFFSSHSSTNTYFIAQVGDYTPPVVAPTVTTQSADQIATTSVRGNGNITDTGGENCTRIGFCYKAGTTGDPTTSDSVVYDDGSFGTGAFTKSITGLTAGTNYRVRAYAVNSAGTGYGTTVDVKTLSAFKPRTMWFN